MPQQKNALSVCSPSKCSPSLTSPLFSGSKNNILYFRAYIIKYCFQLYYIDISIIFPLSSSSLSSPSNLLSYREGCKRIEEVRREISIRVVCCWIQILDAANCVRCPGYLVTRISKSLISYKIFPCRTIFWCKCCFVLSFAPRLAYSYCLLPLLLGSSLRLHSYTRSDTVPYLQSWHHKARSLLIFGCDSLWTASIPSCSFNGSTPGGLSASEHSLVRSVKVPLPLQCQVRSRVVLFSVCSLHAEKKYLSSIVCFMLVVVSWVAS